MASVAYLATKNLKWDRIALACAEIGTIFCMAGLITGPIWAKPVWGIWWTWDARLTSTLLLWLIYLSYMLLRGFLEEPARRASLSAVFGIFGFAAVPFVFMTIRLWRTQHPQPVLMGGEDSGLDPVMFQALMVAWVAFLILFVFLATLRVRLEKSRDEVRQLRREFDGAVRRCDQSRARKQAGKRAGLSPCPNGPLPCGRGSDWFSHRLFSR